MERKKIIAVVAAAVIMLGAAGAAIWFVLIRPNAGTPADTPPAVSDGAGDLMGVPGDAAPTQDGVAGGKLDGAPAGDGEPLGGSEDPGTGTGAPAEPIDLGAPGSLGQSGGDDDEPDNPYGIKPDKSFVGSGQSSTGSTPTGGNQSGSSDANVDPNPSDGNGDGEGSGGNQSGVGNQSGGYEAGGTTTGSGVQAPTVEDTGREPSGGNQGGTDPEPSGGNGNSDGNGNGNGGQDSQPSSTPQPGTSHVKVDGVPATFVKAVYSRNKTRCLVKVSLPSGKAIDDPSKYTVVANVDERGHKPSRGIIYSCPSRDELVIYMSSAGFFAERSSFAIVPTGSSGTLDVTSDCYVELPYGDTYQGSSILDGSSASFRDMMKLMFDDSDVIDTWVSGRKSHKIDSIGLLGDKVDGSSGLQLGGTTQAPSSSTQQPSGGQSGTQLTGPDGGTSAASPSATPSTPPKDISVDSGNADKRRSHWPANSVLAAKESDEKVYHTTECSEAKKITMDHELWFSSVTDAENQGYGKCQLCS